MQTTFSSFDSVVLLVQGELSFTIIFRRTYAPQDVEIEDQVSNKLLH